MELSKYIIPIDINTETRALYHSANGSLVDFDISKFKDNTLNIDSLLEEEIDALEELDFFCPDDLLIEDLENCYITNEKLTISVEITSLCNLRCPYCYQKEEGYKNRIISKESIDKIIKYINNVYKVSKFSILSLTVLGGEPGTAPDAFFELYNGVLEFCKQKAVRLNLSIDTNGTLLDFVKNLTGFDHLALTIPLSWRPLHDNVRKNTAGNGTYDTIIKNINELASLRDDIDINIRHNTDSDNINHFEEFVKDLKNELSFKPNIFINYTLALNGNYESKLDYFEFMKWKASTAIDILMKYDYEILFAPPILMNCCMMNEPYSMKITNSEEVIPCAMYYNHPNKIKLDDVYENIELVNQHYKEKKYSVLDDSCRECKKIFLCGGGRLPCHMNTYGDRLCGDHTSHSVDLELFIKSYYKYTDLGKDELFVYFNDPTPRR